MSGEILAGAQPLENPCAARVEPHRVDELGNLLAAGERYGFAGVLAFERDEFLGAPLERIGDAQQGEAPFPRGRVPPATEGALGRAQSSVDVRRARYRRSGKFLTGRGIDQRCEDVGGRLVIFAIDEVAQGAHSHRAHALRSRASSRKLATYRLTSSDVCCTDKVQFSSAPGAIRTPRLL